MSVAHLKAKLKKYFCPAVDLEVFFYWMACNGVDT